MIVRLIGLLVRVLVETALLLLAVGLLFMLAAARTARRLVSEGEDPLQRISGPAATILELLANARRRGSGVDEVDSEP